MAGWTIGHGHRPIVGERVIFGHHHPCLAFEGRKAACILAGPRSIALPAFSSNAAGLDVRGWDLPDTWRGDPPRCYAGLGGVLLDFGPLARLQGPSG